MLHEHTRYTPSNPLGQTPRGTVSFLVYLFHVPLSLTSPTRFLLAVAFATRYTPTPSSVLSLAIPYVEKEICRQLSALSPLYRSFRLRYSTFSLSLRVTERKEKGVERMRRDVGGPSKNCQFLSAPFSFLLHSEIRRPSADDFSGK